MDYNIIYNTVENTYQSTMNNTITANDLKVKGISVVEKLAKKGIEAIVTVRGEEKFVILPKEEYNRLREFELIAAITETEEDLKNGRYTEESVEDHIRRVTDA